MAFTEAEILQHQATIEKHFWSHHRPPLHLRAKIREGHRIKDRSIVLFYVRPRFLKPKEQMEHPFAKIRHFPGLNCWRIYWMRADLKWHGYQAKPKAQSLKAALNVIHQDAYGCFFG